MQLPSITTFLVASLAATTGASVYTPPTANSLAIYAAPLLTLALAPAGALAFPSYSMFGLEARHRKHHGGNGNGNGNGSNDNDDNGDNNEDNNNNGNGNGNNNDDGDDNGSGNGNAGNGTANATADATSGDSGNNNGGRKRRDDKRGLVRVADLIARDNIDRELAE